MEASDGFKGQAIKVLDTFEPENDPSGCHDFGAVDIEDEKTFCKIDLYGADSDLRNGHETIGIPATAICVLSIFLASDW